MTDTVSTRHDARADLAASPASALRSAGPLAIAAVVANGSNVVVTVLIAHLMSSRGYGSLTELVALFLVLSMPGSALLVAVVRRATAEASAGTSGAGGSGSERWVHTMRRWGAVGLAVWAGLALLARGWLGRQLGLPNPAGVTEVLVAGGAWALLSVERGLLQSRRAYGPLARNLCVEAGVRAMLTVVLIGAGLGVEGAAVALVAAMGASLADSRASLAAHGAPARVPASPPAEAADPVPPPSGVVASVGAGEPAGRHLAADLATALAALGLIAVLQNIDVLRVGHLSAPEAGPYGAISVASKAVVFGALVLSGYLLPEAALRSRQGQHAFGQLAAALGLVALPVAALVGAGLVAPRALLGVAFGPDKTQAAPALATLALAMGCLAASVLLTHYLLGVGQRRVVAVLAVAAAVLVAAVDAAHGRPLATARAELACQVGLAAVLTVVVVKVPRSPRKAP